MAQKELLKLHFRLGHISFAHLQWMVRHKRVLIHHSNAVAKCDIRNLKCASCELGKQCVDPLKPTKNRKSLRKKWRFEREICFLDNEYRWITIIARNLVEPTNLEGANEQTICIMEVYWLPTTPLDMYLFIIKWHSAQQTQLKQNLLWREMLHGMESSSKDTTQIMESLIQIITQWLHITTKMLISAL